MEKVTFDNIANPIIKTWKYQSLKNDYHHGLTRYIHSIKVAKGTYIITRLLKLDYISATRGALLHDYFNEEEYLDSKGLEKPRIHPFLALNNASLEYNLNLKEKNIIISHMFPLGSIKPEYLESWVVSTIDKIVALDEYIVYKFKDKLVLFALFIINIIRFKCNFL